MGANAGAIRAGKAYVEALLDDSKLRKGLAAAQVRIKAFGQGLTDIGTKMALVGTAIAAPMIAAAKVWADAGGRLADMSQRTGVTAERLSALGYAAEQSGSNLESVEGALRRMAKNLSEAGQGSTSAKDALGRLGVSLGELRGKTPDQQFKTLADRIDAIADPSQKAAAAMEIFGKSATDLLPLMSGGSAAIVELENTARKLGITMGNDDAQAAERFGDAMDDVAKITKSATMALGAAAAPAIRETARDLADLLQATRGWIKENQGLVTGALKASVAMVAVGTALAAVGKVITVALPALKALATFFSGPAGWATAGVIAVLQLSGAFRMLSKSIRQSIDDAKGLREATEIQAIKDPVAQAKAYVDSAKSNLDRAKQNYATHTGALGFFDRDKNQDARDLAYATQAYALAQRQYQRALNEAGGSGGGNTGKAAGVDYDTLEARKALEKKALEDLSAAKIAAIDNEALRENARIQETYARKIEEAKAAGASIAALEKARDTELDTLNRRTANERTKEAARQAQEAQKQSESTAKDQADARADMEQEIAKAQIEAMMTGRQKEIALLELERQKALEAARASGVSEDRVNQLFGLKAAALGAGTKRNEEVAGTFSLQAAQQMGPSSGIATAAQKQQTTLDEIQRLLRLIWQAGGTGLVVQ